MPGQLFEDFEIGQVFEHEAARSVTQFDNTWYSCMTLNTQPLHSNIDFAGRSGVHGKPLFNSMYSLSIVIGQTSSDLTQGTMMRTIMLDDVQFPCSVFADDTLYSRSTVLRLQEISDDRRAGTVEFLHEGRNQHGELVVSCRRTVLVRKRAYAVV